MCVCVRAAPPITDSLYNPHYGYFSKQVVIFSPGEPIDFNALRDEPSFHAELGRRYTEFEDALDARSFDSTRQLWHTPTELFRPYYGEAVARYLMSNYIMSTYPYHDLIVYEMGAGRGTLMLNVLDYIRDNEPSIYDRTKYKIIEISPQLATLQRSQLDSAAAEVTAQAASRGHADKVEIINRSIFDWRERVPSPCFFLAMEVFDNFAHDALRYDLRTEEPLQGTVMIDGRGDFHEFYEPVLDPLAARYLRVRDAATAGNYPAPYAGGRAARWLRSQLPFAPNLSDPEYVPTRLLQFFDILERYFPAHRLLTSDFHTLPDAVRGLNSPVVQTRFERRMVPVTTPLVSVSCFCSFFSFTSPLLPPFTPFLLHDTQPLHVVQNIGQLGTIPPKSSPANQIATQVHQGYFDILFPTDFGVMEAVYRLVTGKLTRTMSHEAFMRSWAYVENTRTRSGENPLLSWYANASVLVTV